MTRERDERDVSPPISVRRVRTPQAAHNIFVGKT